MDRRATYNRVAQLIVILLCAFTLKHWYATSGVNELHWILAPTTFLVEFVSGVTFNFESHAGYMSSDRSFLIAASCAGVNFLIAAFLMLSLARLWRARLAWRFIPCAFVLAYLATIVANTIRISMALQLQQTPLKFGSLTSNQIHRLEGIFVYFGFLLVLFLLTERMRFASLQQRDAGLRSRLDISRRPSSDSDNRYRLSQGLLFPLLVYYATTLGMPVANAFYRRDVAAAGFLEHSAFVLLAPLILILPLAAFRFISKDRTAALVSFQIRKTIHELNE